MIMALEGKADILQALNQLLFVCYFVLIFPFIVHNVSAIVSYDQWGPAIQSRWCRTHLF